MDADKIIVILLKWLHDKQNTFNQTAWANLPSLAAEIAAAADDDSFSIAMIISKWCAENSLGEELRRSVREISDPGEALPTTLPPLENLTKIIPKTMMDAYKKGQQPGALNTGDTNNESK